MSPHDLDNAILDRPTDGPPAGGGAVDGNTGRTGGMDKIAITGGTPLKGEIRIGGAKNSALILMCTSILTDGDLVLDNIPRLADIKTTTLLLESLGVSVAMSEPKGKDGALQLTLNGGGLDNVVADYDIVRKMRAGVLVLGPLLAKHGRARVSLPGGCAIGTRPVDLHLKGLAQLGAEIELEGGYIVAQAKGRLKGAEVTFPFVSVGATENLMMAAALADGTTRLVNAAREPEIVDLAECLMAMGARISGAGTDRIEIEGVDALHDGIHSVMPDRIETGTYAMAVAATRGDATLIGARPDTLGAAIEAMESAGVIIDTVPDGMRVRCGALIGTDVMTEPYPGFPTDLQAQMMALMTTAQGASMLTETIFENRFMHVPELTRMGANVNLHGRSAMVRGVPRLTGAPVMATDLRASVALVIAGLAAQGETTVSRIYHLDRGYERLDQKLAACGARIERVPD